MDKLENRLYTSSAPERLQDKIYTVEIINLLFKDWPSTKVYAEFKDIKECIDGEIQHVPSAKHLYSMLNEHQKEVFINVIDFIANYQRIGFID